MRAVNMRRRFYKADRNEKDIVKMLKLIPGIQVQTGHDDILIGFKGKTYWFEIKNPDEVNKDGRPTNKSTQTAKKQAMLEQEWTGHYRIISTLKEILDEIQGLH